MKRIFFLLAALVIALPMMAAAYFALSPYHAHLRATVADPAAREAGILQSLDFEKTRLQAWRGNKEAQYRLGRHFVSGDLGFRSAAQAARWFSRAAGQGHAQAQLNLAALGFSGDGAPKDEAAAAGWTQKAAENGASDAFDLLGVLYLGGIGLPQDLQAGIDALKKAHAGDSIELGVAMEQRLAAVYALPREERDAALNALGAAVKTEMRARLPAALERLSAAIGGENTL
jgi:TPR repeat protein